MSKPKRVFVDANVFVATWTFDALMTLADAGLVDPRWSDIVIDEARRTLRKLGGSKCRGKYIDAADAAYPYANVPVEEADFIGIELPDPDDRHVVAGAEIAGCDVIVTYNMKDFPEKALAARGVRAVHPDSLLMELAESNPKLVIATVKLLVASKRHPPRSITEEIEGLKANALPRFANFIESHVENGE